MQCKKVYNTIHKANIFTCDKGDGKMENLCIYKKSSEGRFEKREHIIPAFIGGMQTLEQGMVSDEVNELFSKLEYRVSLDSLITMNRMFLGPGKRGKQSSKKGSHHKIGVMCGESNRAVLGYTEFAKPRLISQIHFELSLVEGKSFEIGMSLDNAVKDTWEKEREVFFGRLNSYSGEAIILKEECVGLNRGLLGYHNGKWFLAFHPQEDEENARDKAVRIAKLVASEPERLQQTAQVKASSEQVTVHYKHCMDLKDYYRVIAKIAFNTMAYLHGREAVLAECFDDIRQAILTGERIDEFVSFTNEEDSMRVFEELNYQAILGKDAHWVICVRMQENYVALVYLYGIKRPMIVILAKQRIPFHWQSPDGFVCDWQNKKEYRLIEVISRLISEVS